MRIYLNVQFFLIIFIPIILDVFKIIELILGCLYILRLEFYSFYINEIRGNYCCG